MWHFGTGLVLGALVSGVVVAVVVTAVRLLPDGLRLLALLPAAVVVAFELAGHPLSLVQNRRAVPQDVIPRDQWGEGALQFGFEMGTGVRTFMPSALPHVLVLSLLAVGDLGATLLAALGFGLGRAVLPVLRSRSERTAAFDASLSRWMPWIWRTGGLSAVLVVATVVGTS